MSWRTAWTTLWDPIPKQKVKGEGRDTLGTDLLPSWSRSWVPSPGPQINIYTITHNFYTQKRGSTLKLRVVFVSASFFYTLEISRLALPYLDTGQLRLREATVTHSGARIWAFPTALLSDNLRPMPGFHKWMNGGREKQGGMLAAGQVSSQPSGGQGPSSVFDDPCELFKLWKPDSLCLIRKS